MINAFLASTLLTLSPSGATGGPSVEDVLGYYEAHLTPLENGEAIFDYVLCHADPRSRQASPYLAFLEVEELYPELQATLEAIEDGAPEYSSENDDAMLQVLQAKVDERKGVLGCKYTLIPDPEHTLIIAERAAYLRDAMHGTVDPQQDLTDLITGLVSTLSDLPHGDRLITITACAQRYPDRFDQASADFDHAFATSVPGEAAIDQYYEAYSRFAMTSHLFDENAIWDAAYDARVPPMSQGECESLLAPYIEN